MRKIITILIIGLTSFATNVSFAQEEKNEEVKPSPLPIEVFLGDEGFTSQLVIDKNFANSKRFGFFGLSFLRGNYDNDPYLRESVNLAFLKYGVFKGFNILSGAMFNSHWGFRPFAGAQYNYHSKTFMGMITTGFHLTETKNFETISMLEYRPTIKGAWSLYTHVQGLYSQNTLIGEHDRSSLYSRLGLSYKTFSFGAALNYDWYGYGAMKIEDHQWGIFISTLLW